ncbi:MAG: hypothetical protein ACK5LP_04430 [Campylobacteraceae bacterium]
MKYKDIENRNNRLKREKIEYQQEKNRSLIAALQAIAIFNMTVATISAFALELGKNKSLELFMFMALLFGTFFAVIAMLGIRNKDNKEAHQMIIVSIIVSVFGVLLFFANKMF